MFRTVIIKQASKLQYIQGYLVVFDGDAEKRVFLTDISVIIIESTRCLITMPLLIEVVKNNISVLLCNEKHTPTGTILGVSNNFQNSANIYKQIDWRNDISDQLWLLIIKAKIKAQIEVLEMFDRNKTDLLKKYIDEIEPCDTSNREGLAAKVYFNELFGNSFNRSEQNTINGLLDYGYSMILSCFNREIVAHGYFPQLGIHHKGKTNPFNLSCDFMEPFRPLCDIIVSLSLGDENPLNRIRRLLSHKILINDEERFIDDAIGTYVIHMIRYLNQESLGFPDIKFMEKRDYECDQNNETDNNV